MKFIAVILMILTIDSCGDSDLTNNELIGTWRHVESLSDMGDGQSSYHRVNSDKTLTFTEDGKVLSNENVCIGNNFTPTSTAVWNAGEQSFNAGECTASYRMDLETLIISYQCMEACGEKYIRVN